MEIYTFHYTSFVKDNILNQTGLFNLLFVCSINVTIYSK